MIEGVARRTSVKFGSITGNIEPDVEEGLTANSPPPPSQQISTRKTVVQELVDDFSHRAAVGRCRMVLALALVFAWLLIRAEHEQNVYSRAAEQCCPMAEYDPLPNTQAETMAQHVVGRVCFVRSLDDVRIRTRCGGRPDHTRRSLVLSDIQLLGAFGEAHKHLVNRLPSFLRPSLVRLLQYFGDAYLRRSFHAFRTHCLPPAPTADTERDYAVVFLGDIFDEGYKPNGHDFSSGLARFSDIYDAQMSAHRQVQPLSPAGTDIQPAVTLQPRSDSSSAHLKYVYIPGNHDLGVNEGLVQEERIRRWQQFGFGPLNFIVEVGGLEYVALSTLTPPASVIAGDMIRSNEARSADFMNFMQDLKLKQPAASATRARILLSHVPLFRQATRLCADVNDSGYLSPSDRKISPGYGKVGPGDYLSIPQTLTEEIMNNSNPTLVLTGDAHLWCRADHVVGGNTSMLSPELTLRAAGWNSGGAATGVTVLSPLRPTEHPSFDNVNMARVAVAVCNLPDRYSSWGYQGVYFLLSVLLVAIVEFGLAFGRLHALQQCGKLFRRTALLTVFVLYAISLQDMLWFD